MRGVRLDSGCIALGIQLLSFKGRDLLLLWRTWERAGITNLGSIFLYYRHHSSAFQRGKAHGFDLVSLDWFKPYHVLVISQIRKTNVKVSLLMLYLYRVCPSLKGNPVHCLALPECDFFFFSFYLNETVVWVVCLLGGGVQHIAGMLKGGVPVLQVLCVAVGRLKARAVLWVSCFKLLKCSVEKSEAVNWQLLGQSKPG